MHVLRPLGFAVRHHTQLVTLQGVAMQYTDNPILESLDLTINEGDRIAIVGDNGTGKSTLAKLLVGEVQPMEGHVYHAAGLQVGYLPQSVNDLLKYEVNQDTVGEYLAAHVPPDHEDIAQHVYTQLSLPPPNTPLYALSGGQRTKLVLAAHLLKVPDLLVLDEPSNNLDAPAAQWLCHHLSQWKGAVVVITHDRFLLHHLPTAMIEMDYSSALHHCTGMYDQYLQSKLEAIARQQQKYQKDLRHIQHLTAQLDEGAHQAAVKRSVERFEANRAKKKFASGMDQQDGGLKELQRSRAARAKGLDVLLAKLDPPPFCARLDLNFKVKPRYLHKPGSIVLQAQDVWVKRENQMVLKGLNLTVHAGERVVICGENGSGKTTLLRLLAGELKPSEGVVRRARRVGYMTQEQNRDLEMPVKEYLRKGSRLKQPLDTILTDVCGLPSYVADQKLGQLSTGQRRRLQFGHLIGVQASVLVLDEPTNHLDILGKEALERGLRRYNATVVASSHDAYFARVVATRILLLKNGVLEELHFPHMQLVSASAPAAIEEIETQPAAMDAIQTQSAAMDAIQTQPSTPMESVETQSDQSGRIPPIELSALFSKAQLTRARRNPAKREAKVARSLERAQRREKALLSTVPDLRLDPKAAEEAVALTKILYPDQP
eukprot:NODE_486_length_2167_cov_34.138235_g450_i0.p1 GENE.NODE_486_length_2167_cov_34.138235_g450_i0~~NODE_486_length_2167_cov_34.138235_g450_i0.p1  ORF type:complete len:670 (+),score=169.86 NODE_486_length_2167_cov_34.138235_g450_i0:37-2010(+)